MNSQMRRIDLVCKLFGPFLIGFLDGTVSTEVAVLVNFGMNILSIPLEYWFIAQVDNMDFYSATTKLICCADLPPGSRTSKT